MRYLMMLLVMGLLGCGKETPLTIIPEKISDTDLPVATKTIKAFLEACPNMAALSADIEKSTVSFGYDDNSEFLQRGWRKPIELIVKFNDRPQDRRLVEWRTFGNTCYYMMGGGIKPGWSTGKEACAQVCGVSRHGEKDGELFAAVPQLRFLDDPATAEYQQAVATAKKQWQDDIATELAAAHKGEQDALSNVAYLWGHGALGETVDKYKECVWRAVYYYRAIADIDSGMVRDPKRRMELAASNIERYRTRARDTCIRNLPTDQVWAAIDEADNIANTFPGRRPLRRPVLED